jgi:arginase family enzyme
VDEVGERAERLLDIDVGLVAVDLVEVDPVGAEAFQRVLDLADDPAARDAALVRVIAHRPPCLGGEHDVIAPAAGERLADDDL